MKRTRETAQLASYYVTNLRYDALGRSFLLRTSTSQFLPSWHHRVRLLNSNRRHRKERKKCNHWRLALVDPQSTQVKTSLISKQRPRRGTARTRSPWTLVPPRCPSPSVSPLRLRPSPPPLSLQWTATAKLPETLP